MIGHLVQLAELPRGSYVVLRLLDDYKTMMPSTSRYAAKVQYLEQYL
jgi:hypothetical protein